MLYEFETSLFLFCSNTKQEKGAHILSSWIYAVKLSCHVTVWKKMISVCSVQQMHVFLEKTRLQAVVELWYGCSDKKKVLDTNQFSCYLSVFVSQWVALASAVSCLRKHSCSLRSSRWFFCDCPFKRVVGKCTSSHDWSGRLFTVRACLMARMSCP